MKYALFLLSAALLSAQSTLSVEQDENSVPIVCSKRNESSLPALKGPNPGCEETVTGVCTARNVPHRLTDKGFFISSDFLFWRADEDGLEFAQFYDGLATLSQTVSTSTTKILDINFDWDPGFRVGLGWQIPRWDGWDIFANIAYFNTKASASKSIPLDLQANQAVFDVWVPQLLSSPPAIGTEARAQWKLFYTVYDLEMGRDFFVSSKLAMRPFLSARGANIRQNYYTHYAGNINNSDTLPYTATMAAKNDYWGAGIRGGSGLHWHFTDQFGLVGQLSFALLFGQFTVSQNVRGFNVQSISVHSPYPTKQYIFNTDYYRMRANLEGQLALRAEFPLFCNQQLLQFDLGYDFAVWFGQNQLNRFGAGTMFETTGGGGLLGSVEYVKVTPNILMPNCQNGNLGLQGLFFNAHYQF